MTDTVRSMLAITHVITELSHTSAHTSFKPTDLPTCTYPVQTIPGLRISYHQFISPFLSHVVRLFVKQTDNGTFLSLSVSISLFL